MKQHCKSEILAIEGLENSEKAALPLASHGRGFAKVRRVACYLVRFVIYCSPKGTNVCL